VDAKQPADAAKSPGWRRFAALDLWLGVIIVLSLLYLLALLVIGMVPDRWGVSNQSKIFLLAGATSLFGASVGAAEVFSKYRDAPFRAVATLPAVGYLILNGLISLAAFAILLRYSAELLPAVSGDIVMMALVAGFGGMAIARSKFFTLKGEQGEEFSFGPALVLDSFLNVLDRRIDRIRATHRQRLVFQRIRDLPTDQTSFLFALSFLLASLQSFQNLTEEEKESYAELLAGYRDLEEWPPKLRMFAAGFALLNLVGEENFDQVIDELRRDLLNTDSE